MAMQFIMIPIPTAKVNNLLWLTFPILILSHFDFTPFQLLINIYTIKIEGLSFRVNFRV